MGQPTDPAPLSSLLLEDLLRFAQGTPPSSALVPPRPARNQPAPAGPCQRDIRTRAITATLHLLLPDTYVHGASSRLSPSQRLIDTLAGAYEAMLLNVIIDIDPTLMPPTAAIIELSQHLRAYFSLGPPARLGSQAPNAQVDTLDRLLCLAQLHYPRWSLYGHPGAPWTKKFRHAMIGFTLAVLAASLLSASARAVASVPTHAAVAPLELAHADVVRPAEPYASSSLHSCARKVLHAPPPQPPHVATSNPNPHSQDAHTTDLNLLVEWALQ